jgi:hypothetical protein
MHDNSEDLHKHFELAWSNNGGIYRCRKCNLPCLSEETEMPCKGNQFVTTRVKCHLGCGRTWRLEVCPEPSEVAVQ